MPNLARVRVVVGGGAVVGPSVSTFFFNAAGTGWTSDLTNFYDAVKNRHPSSVTFQIPRSGDILDETTGDLVGSWTEAVAGNVTGTGASLFAKGVGYRVKWTTSGVHNGRRVVGSTYMVPMDLGMLDAAGDLGSVQMTAINVAATALVASPSHELRVWSRPVNGAGGESHVVTSGSVPDAISWLRSRRV
jgi:hypothetical protein